MKLTKEMKTAILFLVIGLIIGYLLAVGFAATGSATGKVTYQCSDKLDNDGDGRCDWAGQKRCSDGSIPGDPDCSSKTDNKEATDCIPTTEVCDGIDNDCDTLVDEGLTQQCGITDVGECQYGVSTCSNGIWGSCVGNIDPTTEVCDAKDNNCDGLIDEGGVCGPADSCSDSDGGFITGTQGTVSGYKNSVPYSNTDFCIDSWELTEYYCSGSYAYAYNYSCPPTNTTGCSNGTCV